MTSSTKAEQNLIDVYRTKKAFGAIDIIIIGILIIAIIFACVFLFSADNGTYAVIYENGKETVRYNLNNNLSVDLLDGRVILKIEDGSCFIQESDCKNQICVRTKPVSKVGERIVCAPNKISIVIKGTSDDVIITGGES